MRPKKKKITRKARAASSSSLRASVAKLRGRVQQTAAHAAAEFAEKLADTLAGKNDKSAPSAYVKAAELYRKAARATPAGALRDELAVRAEDMEKRAAGRRAGTKPPATKREIDAFLGEQHRRTVGLQGWNEADADEIDRRARAWLKERGAGSSMDGVREQFRRIFAVYEAETFGL